MKPDAICGVFYIRFHSYFEFVFWRFFRVAIRVEHPGKAIVRRLFGFLRRLRPRRVMLFMDLNHS